MKHKASPILRLVLLLCALILIAALIAIGLFYYVFSIPEPEGLSLTSWPRRFTENFAAWMKGADGRLTVEESGLKRLDAYGLWLQALDESGREVLAYRKPEERPTSYTASELLSLSASAYEGGSTVFVSRFEDGGTVWSYLIGFPYAVGKHMLYYNGDNVARLSPFFRGALLFLLAAMGLLLLAFGFWLVRQLGKLSRGVSQISLRAYEPLPERGFFSGICAALNKMDSEIRRNDEARRDTERARREWIANITHDLKTPLSPVKGYAELLSSASEDETAREYGQIILRNVAHAEKLIGDLKLTYQLDSGAVPYHPQETRISRYVKEAVIDIVNDPAFSGRELTFESHVQDAVVLIDPDLFRRAVQNLIVNALTHNPPDTRVSVAVEAGSQRGVEISVCDNGVGMSEKEQSQLFSRYYRGTSTREKPEGSGLGLAIAKQIITLHGGELSVKSRPGEGTRFTIVLPYQADDGMQKT